MGKYKKQLRLEKAKVKLRTKKEKDKLLPKGLNITNVSFKSKKIQIQEQLKPVDDSLILSRRKLDVKALLSRLEHHNTKSRQEALKDLTEILTQHKPEDLISPLHPLLRGVLSLTLDIEKVVRREAIKVLHLVLSQIPVEKFSYDGVIIPFLGCTMAHINPNVREDSLLLLETITNDCNHIIIENQDKIIPNLMDLISRLHADSNRRLLNNLSTKTTTIKWTTKILLSLANIFNSIVSNEALTANNSNFNEIIIDDSSGTFHIPLYVNKNLITPYSIDFKSEMEKDQSLNYSKEFFHNIDQLLPLIFDCWVEVSSKETFDKNDLNNDELELLQSIIMIFQSIIDYMDILERKNKSTFKDTSLNIEFKKKFQQNFIDRIFTNMPYFRQKSENKTSGRKRQKDFTEKRVTGCDEQNLALCCIFVWLTKIQSKKDRKLNLINKDIAMNLIDFLNDKLKSWSRLNSSAQLHLVQILQKLFLEVSDTWRKYNLTLESTLQTVFEVYSETSNQEIKRNIFSLFESIAMDHNLTKLHSDRTFKQFVKTLLPRLLSATISESTIRLLNNIVMRKLDWVRGFLEENKESIIENTRTIEVTGSNNLHDSRLKICNLFYFTDGMVYF